MSGSHIWEISRLPILNEPEGSSAQPGVILLDVCSSGPLLLEAQCLTVYATCFWTATNLATGVQALVTSTLYYCNALNAVFTVCKLAYFIYFMKHINIMLISLFILWIYCLCVCVYIICYIVVE